MTFFSLANKRLCSPRLKHCLNVCSTYLFEATILTYIQEKRPDMPNLPLFAIKMTNRIESHDAKLTNNMLGFVMVFSV